jgi:hypothetical protein
MFDLPYWAGAALLTFGLPLVAEAGFQFHGVMRRSRLAAAAPNTPEELAQFLSRAIALLSLLLAFTLSSAAARHEARREMVAQEADQIVTTYLRAQLLEEPARGRLSGLLGQYARHRRTDIEDFAAGTSARARSAAVVEADQRRLWTALTEARRQPDADQLKTKFLESMNSMFTSARLTHAAMEARTARSIILLLLFYSSVVAVISGYHMSVVGKRYPLLSGTLLTMFAWVMLTVDDLDHPGKGLINIGTAPLTRTIEWIDRSEAAGASATPGSGAGGEAGQPLPQQPPP